MMPEPGYFGKTDQKQKFLDVVLEKIRWNDHVRKKQVLRTVEREEYPTYNKRKEG